MAKYYDTQNHIQEVSLSPSIYREAHDAGMSVENYINTKYPTKEGNAPAFDQMAASLGIAFRNDDKSGMRAARLRDVLDGKLLSGQSAVNTSPGGGAPESRVIFPATLIAAAEDKLARDYSTAANAFDRMIALSETIPGNKFDQIIMHFQNAEANTTGATAQLARPQNMATLTVSDRQGVIPVTSSGIEWSDQFAQGATIDFLALTIARTMAKQRDLTAQRNTLALLDGDVDIGQGPIPAQFRHKANQFDPSITTNGKITQLAWVKWLYNMGDIRTIDWIITDIDTAMAIENREGKPVIVGDDPNSPRIDSQIRVANPLIPADVKVFVTRNPDWPAGTILGLDSRYAIRRITSLSANYQATEQDVIRRANEMRWDFGVISFRMYEEAFSVLELTV